VPVTFRENATYLSFVCQYGWGSTQVSWCGRAPAPTNVLLEERLMIARLVRQLGSLFGSKGSLADSELEDIPSAAVMLMDVVPPPIPQDARRKSPKSPGPGKAPKSAA
jgi:hypothetical protein